MKWIKLTGNDTYFNLAALEQIGNYAITVAGKTYMPNTEDYKLILKAVEEEYNGRAKDKTKPRSTRNKVSK